ncbi:Plasmodium exported protein, unknown function [Plasmodium ovale]|uniref:Uncharacterized protein n=1 Tax=Plasmodium ovale TaxID=36330 RepID=A0A1D3THC2_PLAOA|nr:Plasmodium exported protein, unknown function [Plasmodium ovale]
MSSSNGSRKVKQAYYSHTSLSTNQNRTKKKGNITNVSFYKLLISSLKNDYVSFFFRVCMKQGNVSPSEQFNHVEKKTRILSVAPWGDDPWGDSERSAFRDDEFELIVDKWVAFEERTKRDWQEIDDYELDEWKQLLFGTWLAVSLAADKSANNVNMLHSWHDMCQRLGSKRLNKNEEDNKILERIMKKLKYRALNKMIKNWDVEIEEFWRKIIQMKLEKNAEWANLVKESCNNWVKEQF